VHPLGEEGGPGVTNQAQIAALLYGAGVTVLSMWLYSKYPSEGPVVVVCWLALMGAPWIVQLRGAK